MIEVINRELLIPREEYNIGTCYDDNTETRHFHLKRVTSGGVDLAALTFNLDIQYADGNTDAASLVKEVTDKDINLVLTINNSMLQVPGTVLIQIRALDEDGVCKWTSYKSAFFVEDHINTPGHYEGDLTQLEQYEAEWGKVRDNVNQLNSRMDEVVKIHNDTPATEVEEEVIDGRVGYDGTQYDSFGTAVRQQIIDVREDMEEGTADWTEALAAEATARTAADATLQGNINAEASTRASADSNLQSQINQIIAPSGEAPSAAEVQNARIGADGVTYDTLGDAIREQVGDLKSVMKYHDAGVFVNANPSSYITYNLTWEDNETVTITGTSDSFKFVNLIEGTLDNLGIKPGDTLLMNIEVLSGSNVPQYQIFYKTGGDDFTKLMTRTYSDICTVPDNATYWVFRIGIPAGTWDTKFRISLQKRGDNLKYFAEDYIPAHKEAFLPSGTDLNNVVENGLWLIPAGTGFSYDNYPLTGKVTYLLVYTTFNSTAQILIPFREEQCLKRISLDGEWRSWQKMYPEISKVPTAQDYGYGDISEETTDLNDLKGNQVRLLNDSHTYTNKPNGMGIGFVVVFYTGLWHLQLAWNFSGNKMWKRRGNGAGTAWENWQEIGGPSGNTYNYLAPTGDTTDRTADILAMLNSTGICRLGAGDYYVTDLVMPDYSSIIGSGFATKVRLTTNGNFAIAPKSHCTVKDLRIMGGVDGSVTPSATVGTRHGILWQGDYTQSHTAPFRCILDNLMIINFTGGGITCYDTGYGTSNCIEATNIYILNCSAGLNISYWSEFHKFTNVRCSECYYGCINNGGNNLFVNCDFSSNREIAMLMDNSQGQSPNNTHGSAIGCVFNHTAHDGTSNAGIGIEILNCHSGFIFTGCQIFFSQIHLVDSDGIVISDTNFGYRNCDVNISGGGTVLFSNCMNEGAIPITVTNNQNVHFVNCYNKATGAMWSN